MELSDANCQILYEYLLELEQTLPTLPKQCKRVLICRKAGIMANPTPDLEQVKTACPQLEELFS